MMFVVRNFGHGQQFRILNAMGPVYTGMIESLRIEKDVIREAAAGQKVGLKIRDFNRVRFGDQVESFRSVSVQHSMPWQPQGRIFFP